MLNTYSSQISNKPNVNLVVIPNLDNDGRKALIELTNHGSAAATNISLTIEAPKMINNITNEFSTTDITIPKFNKTLLDMHVPKTINQSSLKLNIAKFTAGSGSMIKLETFMDAKQNLSYYNYIVSAAYDQGSTMGKVMKPSDALTLSNLPNRVAEYIVENPILVLSEIAIIPAGWITIKWWLGKRFRQHFISELIDNMLNVRRILIHLPSQIDSQKNLPDQIKNELILSTTTLAFLFKISFSRKFKNYLDVADVIRIQDLSGKLRDILHLRAMLSYIFAKNKKKISSMYIKLHDNSKKAILSIDGNESYEFVVKEDKDN